jgi:hypothetical protein
VDLGDAVDVDASYLDGDPFAVQGNLLDRPLSEHAVANTPGATHRGDPATSRAAAAKVSLRAGALKHRILAALAAAGDEGLNDYELWKRCDPRGRTHSAANRRKTLGELGLLRRTGRTHPTDGGEGVVSVITPAGLDVLATLPALDHEETPE